MVRISERAAVEIKRQTEKAGKPDAWLTLGISGGGCSGFRYLFYFMDPLKVMMNSDHLYEEFGVKLFVDRKSAIYLDGTEIDFEPGIRNHGFKINNPNQKGSCGCGESVQF